MPSNSEDTNLDGLKALFALPTVPAVEFACWKPSTGRSRPTPASPPPHFEDPLSEAELRYLRAVVERPGRPSSEYSSIARLGRDRCAAIRSRLAELGYVRLHEVATGTKGRHSIVVEPLEPARTMVRNVPERKT